MYLGAGNTVPVQPLPGPLQADRSGKPEYTPSPIQAAYIDLLSRWRWQQFTTNTFRQSVHPERADKVWRVWISKMNRHLFGSRWSEHKEGLGWVRASEMQKRDVLHFHGLLCGPGSERLDYRKWKEEWFDMAGIARLEVPTSSDAVTSYVSKYVVKGGEIDFGGVLDIRDIPPGLFPCLAVPLTTKREGGNLSSEDRSVKDRARPVVRKGRYTPRRRTFELVAGAALDQAEIEPPTAS